MKLNWNCLEKETGSLDRVTCIMDSQKYRAILQSNGMPSIKKWNLGDHWSFQQDSDPKHTSKLSLVKK